LLLLKNLVLISIFSVNTLLQVEDYDLTYAGCSFKTILNQTMYALGYDWKYADEWPTCSTTRFQEKLLATKRGSSDPPTSWPPLNVDSRPCACTFEARETALFNALNYSMTFVNTTSVIYTSLSGEYEKVKGFLATYVCMNFGGVFGHLVWNILSWTSSL
jgi:hypothetical protein